ncbi:Borealin N terminal-domain-containing protein [Triangularia verruculosa]|uniref:Borealin N terminal-domain-containing protein n=1 Tax=Triangularia verruculosa TaxID=2587418 RepID=A0AAN6XFW4_9PEZI|nr:Borealin N terminal-domain-containing protein [Triangularia verruculosa]
MSSDNEMAMVPTETALEGQRSPAKMRRRGVTASQKQALIENLQLEITERARKLRSNYNIHAQSLRTRIEIRVNRIPMSLRKMKMGDLLDKYSNQQQQHQRPPVAGYLKGPPVPEKDPNPSKVYPPRAGGLGYQPTTTTTAGAPKRRSHEMTGGDKENEIDSIANPKKRAKAEPSQAAPQQPLSRNQNNVLSPTSSNTRTIPRVNPTTTPGNTIRSGIARPTNVSPTKGAAATSHSLNNTINRPPPSVSRPGTSASARKMNFSSSTSTTASSSAVKRKRAATAAGPAAQPAKPGTRTGQQRRVSGTSESSEASTSTVIRKRPATAPGERPPITKAMSSGHAKTKSTAGAAAVGSTKKAATIGATAGKKTVAAAAAAAGGKAGSAGRVLRKRA